MQDGAAPSSISTIRNTPQSAGSSNRTLHLRAEDDLAGKHFPGVEELIGAQPIGNPFKIKPKLSVSRSSEENQMTRFVRTKNLDVFVPVIVSETRRGWGNIRRHISVSS